MPAFLVDTNASFGQDCIDIEQIIIKGVFVKDNEVKIIFTRFNADKMSERTDYESFENVFTSVGGAIMRAKRILRETKETNKRIILRNIDYQFFEGEKDET